MSDAAVHVPASLKKTARAAGILYFAFLVFGMSAEIIRGSLVVAGDAAATAANLVANDFLFRLGAFSELLGETVFVFLVLALYALFKGSNRVVARTMVALVLVSIPIAMISVLGQFGALFTAGQDADQAMLFLQLYKTGVQIAGIFWGLWLFPFGWLSFKSGFIPKALGVLLMAGCFGYLGDSLLALVFPGNDTLAIPGMVVVTVAELAMILWLLIFGVKTTQKKGEML